MIARLREPTTTARRRLFFLLIMAVVCGFIGNAALFAQQALSNGSGPKSAMAADLSSPLE
jgi:hypothetical protein